MADKIRNVKVAFIVDDSDIKATDVQIDHLKKTINDSSAALAKMSVAGDKAFDPTEVKQYNAQLATQKKSVDDLGKVYTNLNSNIQTAYSVDRVNNYDKATTKAVTSTKTLGQSIKELALNSPLAPLVGALDQASDSAKSVASNVDGIGKNAKGSEGGIISLGNALKVGVLGTLALIIVAFSSVVAFIKQTDEGALKLESTMDGLGAATDVFTGRLASLGSRLVDSFNEATGATGGFFDKISSVGKYLPGIIGEAFRLGDAFGNSGLGKDMKAAYNEAAGLTRELDAVQDGMRSLSVETTQTEFALKELLKQTKDKGLDISEKLKINAQAQALETESLNKNFEAQKKYYEIIARQTFLKVSNINSDKEAQLLQVKGIVNQIKEAKTADELLKLYQQQNKAQEGLLNTSDANNQKQVDSLIKIQEISGRSDVLQAKYAANESALIEQDIAQRVEAVKAVERSRQAAAINTINDDKKLAQDSLNIQIDSLEAQKAILNQFGKDVSAIDLEIATLRKKYADDAAKAEAERKAKEKAEAEKQAKALQQILADSYREEKALNAQGYNERQRELDNQYTLGGISLKEFNKRKTALDYEQKRNELENDVSYYQNKIDNENLNHTDRITAQEQLNAKQKELYDLDTANYTKSAADKNAILQQQLNQASQAVQITQSIISSIYQLGAENDATLAVFQKGLALVTIGINAATAVSNAVAAAKGVTGIDYIIQVGAGVAAVLAAIAQAKQVLGSSGSVPPAPQLKSAPSASGSSTTPKQSVSQPSDVKKFADGVIDLQGGTRGIDSISAMLMPGESVMTTEETRMFKPVFMAIRNKQVSPEVLNNLGRGGSSVNVTVKNDELAEIYRNRPIHSMNIDEQGFTKYIITKAKKQQVIASKYSM